MAKGDFLGEFEHLVLLALVRLGPGAYGVPVRQEIEQRTGRETSIGAVYATLDRLEGKGLVRSQLGAPSPERGGRAKRLFEVTGAGRTALAETQQALRSMLAGLDDPLAAGGGK